MRSYGQHCALAKALDLVGDRWTLLIVRELLIHRACRYTDLQQGLPGIATNLLADRLSAMESAGLLFREDAPPPVATTLFRLTSRGEQARTNPLSVGRMGRLTASGERPEEGRISTPLAGPPGPPLAARSRTESPSRPD